MNTAQLFKSMSEDNSSDMDSDSSITSRGSSAKSVPDSTEIPSFSFQTPGQTSKKKIVRRTNAQIKADNFTKAVQKAVQPETEKMLTSTISSERKADVKTEVKSEVAASTIDINGVTFPVQLARSNWLLAEQIALITACKSWDDCANWYQY